MRGKARGHIERRRGRYWAVMELEPAKDLESGERVRNRQGLGSYRTKAEAEEVLDDALERARRGWRGPTGTTIAEYLNDEWTPNLALDRPATTVELYKTIVRAYVIPHLGGIRLDALTSADLSTFYRKLLAEGGRGGRPLKARTVRNVHRTIRRALADAVDRRPPLIAWNPAVAAKAPKLATTKEPTVWKPEQVATFLDYVRSDRLAALWILAATSGMRRGELLGLRWSDVDLDAPALHVRQTLVEYGSVKLTKEPKTERSRRTLPLAPRVVEALKAHHRRQAQERLAAGPAWSEQGFVFTDEIGDPLKPGTVTRSVARLAKAAGLPRLTPHGLRHTYATAGLEAGVDVLYVAGLLGHSSPTITQTIYQHVRPERLSDAAGTIAKTLEG